MAQSNNKWKRRRAPSAGSERQRAYRIAQRSTPTSSKQLFEKLVEKEVPVEIATEVLASLQDAGLQRDADIAEHIASSKWRMQRWSPSRTTRLLREKLFVSRDIRAAVYAAYVERDDNSISDADVVDTRDGILIYTDDDFCRNASLVAELVASVRRRFRIADTWRRDGDAHGLEEEEDVSSSAETSIADDNGDAFERQRQSFAERDRLRRRIGNWLAYRGHNYTTVQLVVNEIEAQTLRNEDAL